MSEHVENGARCAAGTAGSDVPPGWCPKGHGRGVLDRLCGLSKARAALGVAVEVTPAEPKAPTVKAVWQEYIEMKRGRWKPGSKTEANERARFNAYVLPTLADKPINTVSRADLVDVLSPVWYSRPEVANKLKRSLSGLFDFATGKDLIGDNPMRYALLAEGKQERTENHHGAIPYADAPAALAYVRASRTYPVKRLAFAFMALTAARTGEVRGVTWGRDRPGRVDVDDPRRKDEVGARASHPLESSRQECAAESLRNQRRHALGIHLPEP